MKSNFSLRPYQKKLIQGLRQSMRLKNRRIILCSPTGSGKTVMFTYMIRRHIDKGGRVLVFTHRKELLSQSSKTFKAFNLVPELIIAGSDPDLIKSLHVAMVETLSRRSEDYNIFISSRTMIIIDEAHLNSFNKLLPYISPGTLVVGATATPYRKGKKMQSLDIFYQDLVQDVDVPELLQLGYLSKPMTYGIEIDLSKAKKIGDDYDTSSFYEENKTYIGVVENWERICKNTKTILFANNVKSSIQVCNEFKSKGYNARHIDGNTSSKNRDEILEWFENTNSGIICNCGILNAGFDQPDIKTVILYRATTSLPLYLQMVGRGSRITKNKNSFYILDFGNNVRRMDFWESPRVWSLKKDDKKLTKNSTAPVKECEGCSAIIPVNTIICPYCGLENKIKKKKEEFAELKLLTRPNLLKHASKQSNIELVKMCKAKLISPFWVLHNKTDLKDARLFCSLMGYKMPGFEYMNKNRFNIFRE